MITVYACLAFLLFLFLLYCWIQLKIRKQERRLNVHVGYDKITNQDDDVWNISSRVNQQNQDGTPPNWPTHDHRLSMDFVITPEYNIKDTRPPPPPYSELDLPSYEQATGCRPPRADLTPVHQQSDQNRPGPSS
ncbi:uncharacterized protein [Onthophagus taurus]|uniref:uncharacterized protein isoform X13 n=1 Tax=Onthophagus taurus TaxID=166361 RepID=UPI000C20A846|nr:uncharacterized protein LOC111415269 isoform X7 [Onthophagus taurus]